MCVLVHVRTAGSVAACRGGVTVQAKRCADAAEGGRSAVNPAVIPAGSNKERKQS